MLKDQNRIELQVRGGIYDEFTLKLTDTATLLPGALVAETTGGTDDFCAISSQAADMNGFEALVVLENALLGKGLHARQYPGEALLARRAVEGDMYLLRAVAGTYTCGQPLYATQTANGIYVSATGEGRFIGWAQENYTITPTMVDVVDDSTRETPSTVNVNWLMANLLRVRIGKNKPGATQPAPPASITFTALADGDATHTSTKITLTLSAAPESDIAAADITLTPATTATAGALTKISGTVYELAITPVSSGTASVAITKTGIAMTPATTDVVLYEAPVAAAVGYWGVVHPDVRAVSPSTTPAAEEILELHELNEITGVKRNIDCTFTMNAIDWQAAGGTTPFENGASGRAFFLTQDWGTATAITSNSFNVSEAFDPFTIELNGVSYSGYIANDSPVEYDGTHYTFTFV